MEKLKDFDELVGNESLPNLKLIREISGILGTKSQGRT